MKRTLILCLLFILSNNLGYCATTFFPPLQPITQDAFQDNSDTNSITSLPDPFARPANNNYSEVSKVEQSIFGRSFENQDISTRLSRIERSIFSRTYSNVPNSQRIDNIISNFNQINKYPNISQNELSKMESKIFHQAYKNDSTPRRVERLEQQVLGATQSGDLTSRYKTLLIASKAYNQSNTDYANISPNTITQGRWKGLGGLSNYMSGTMTGFTPPITPYGYNPFNNFNNVYNSYTRPYTNGYSSSSGYGNMPGRNTGYREYNGVENCNTGVGVTILD